MTGRAILTPVTLVCLCCEKEFTVAGSKAKAYDSRQGKVRKYCSSVCFNKHKKIPIPTFNCAHCGKLTERKGYKNAKGSFGIFNYKTKFCSISCSAKAQPRVRNQGAGSIDKNGYRLLKRDGKYTPEHRLVMEQVLGRPLRPEETVHHINGQKLDNSSSNLELWAANHGKGQRVVDQVEWAISILKQYPEFLEKRGYQIVPAADESNAEEVTTMHVPLVNKQQEEHTSLQVSGLAGLV